MKREAVEGRVRAGLIALFRLTERLHAEGSVAQKEAREAAGDLFEPLADAHYLAVAGDRVVAGDRIISAENAGKLRAMMNHFLVMKPIWDAWEAEKAPARAPPLRKKMTEDFFMTVPGFGAITLPVRSKRVGSLANKLAERGLLEKSKDGSRNVYRFSEWFRACFPVLIRAK